MAPAGAACSGCEDQQHRLASPCQAHPHAEAHCHPPSRCPARSTCARACCRWACSSPTPPACRSCRTRRWRSAGAAGCAAWGSSAQGTGMAGGAEGVGVSRRVGACWPSKPLNRSPAKALPSPATLPSTPPCPPAQLPEQAAGHAAGGPGPGLQLLCRQHGQGGLAATECAACPGNWGAREPQCGAAGDLLASWGSTVAGAPAAARLLSGASPAAPPAGHLRVPRPGAAGHGCACVVGPCCLAHRQLRGRSRAGTNARQDVVVVAAMCPTPQQHAPPLPPNPPPLQAS